MKDNIHLGVIVLSIFSYLTAAVASLLGYPAVKGDPHLQGLSYLIIALVIWIAVLYDNENLKLALTALYGVAAMLAFSGIVVWNNYDGTLSLGPYMAAWDILLGVCIFSYEDK